MIAALDPLTLETSVQCPGDPANISEGSPSYCLLPVPGDCGLTTEKTNGKYLDI